MKILTRNFLTSKFREYYLSASLDLPPGFESREWGFILFDDVGMRRHKSYLNRGEIIDYVRSMVPAHLYHSAAYYKHPAAPTMKEKEWLGADLIFDLDADHLRKAPKSYSEMLDLVKKETLKLLTFLVADFGFSERNINIVFSGGRGYHIHVRDQHVLTLGSDERREILDYITGRGLDINRYISEEPRANGESLERQSRYLAKKVIRKYYPDMKGYENQLIDEYKWKLTKDLYSYLKCPPEGSPGWGGRINRTIISFVTYLSSLNEDEAINIIIKKGKIGEDTAKRFYNDLKRPYAVDLIREGNLDITKGGPKVFEMLIEEYLDGESIHLNPYLDEVKGETDEPVTADIRRLIRCPGSLHGGSGFRVTPLDLKSLESFEPLLDAVIFGDEPIPVEITRPFSTEIRGESYKLVEGRTEVPACAAVFLMARGVAELGQSF